MREVQSANTIALEVKKDGLRQRQSGDWVLSLVIASAGMDQRVTAAAMGKRYRCELVEIKDDEIPKGKQPAKTNGAKLEWRDLGPAQQAALRCRDPVFWAFLEEEKAFRVRSEEEAADSVRKWCGVASRSEIGSDADARKTWFALDHHFQAWKLANG
jgi:hypothetical protein